MGSRTGVYEEGRSHLVPQHGRGRIPDITTFTFLDHQPAFPLAWFQWASGLLLGMAEWRQARSRSSLRRLLSLGAQELDLLLQVSQLGQHLGDWGAFQLSRCSFRTRKDTFFAALDTSTAGKPPVASDLAAVAGDAATGIRATIIHLATSPSLRGFLGMNLAEQRV